MLMFVSADSAEMKSFLMLLIPAGLSSGRRRKDERSYSSLVDRQRFSPDKFQSQSDLICISVM